MILKTLAVAALVLAVSACTSDDESASGGAAQAAADNNDRQVATAPMAPKYAPGSQDELNATIGDRVFFDTDRYNLTPEARATIGSWADWMQTNGNVAISIEGHCDERGTREYNLALGARRANAIKDYLGALGVSPSRISTVSFGKERPAVLGSNAEAWSQNRRGAVVVQ